MDFCLNSSPGNRERKILLNITKVFLGVSRVYLLFLEFKNLFNPLRHMVRFLGCPVQGQVLHFDDSCGSVSSQYILWFYDGSMILLDFLEKIDEKVLLSLILSKRNHLSKIYLCSFQREPILYDLLSKDADP